MYGDSEKGLDENDRWILPSCGHWDNVRLLSLLLGDIVFLSFFFISFSFWHITSWEIHSRHTARSWSHDLWITCQSPSLRLVLSIKYILNLILQWFNILFHLALTLGGCVVFSGAVFLGDREPPRWAAAVYAALDRTLVAVFFNVFLLGCFSQCTCEYK